MFLYFHRIMTFSYICFFNALLSFFICFSELNDTVVEAQLRTKQIPPPIQSIKVLESFSQSNNRLLILVLDLVFIILIYIVPWCFVY